MSFYTKILLFGGTENSPVDWPQELHPALLGDHLDGPWECVFPVSPDTEPDPAELDLAVVAAAEVVSFLHLGDLGHAVTRNNCR